MHDALSDSTLVALDIAPISSSANVNGVAMDMQGWDGIQYVFQLGTMASGATYDARIVSSANANMSGATNITNAALTQVAVGGNANIYIIDVWRPSDRYVRSATQPAVAAVLHTSIATRYRRNGVLPPTQGAIQQIKVAVN